MRASLAVSQVFERAMPQREHNDKTKIRVMILPILIKADCVRVLTGKALPRASHSGEITLASSRHLCSTLAAAPVLFAQAVVTETEIGGIITTK